MRLRRGLLPLPTCVLLAALGCARREVAANVALERAYPNLAFARPVKLLQPPMTPNEVWVVELAGRVVASPNHGAAAQPDVREVVDLTSVVSVQGEGGLLGLAFHPEWPARREVFVSYTEAASNGPALRSVVARIRSLDDGATLKPGSEERLLVLDQPYDNHNGGDIAFGPDGFLYVGFGDGGGRGDPLGAGQRTDTVLGKMLRLDVNVPAAERYAIPADNPFASTGAPCQREGSESTHPSIDRCAEIYALGFRNPWRWSFDRDTGDLWVADVGQSAWEEVNRVVLGGNYGWSEREGAHCFEAGGCRTEGFTDPVVEYGTDLGRSVTGGFVYRGTGLSHLVGSFLFADFVSGRIWAVTGEPGAYARTELADTELSIVGFGQTLDGEVYVLDFAEGTVHRLINAPEP